MSQKGGIALIILIVIVLIGLLGGVYLISQNTSWFSNAGSAQITIPYMSPSPTSATPSKTTDADYVNPFEVESAVASYENPFESGYKNPFEDL